MAFEYEGENNSHGTPTNRISYGGESYSSETKDISKMSAWLIKKGLAKSEKTSIFLLIGVVIFNIILIIVILLTFL